MRRALLLLLLLALPAQAAVFRYTFVAPGRFPSTPVPQFIVADTEAELPTNDVREGDIAYTKDTDKVWKRTAAAWEEVGAGGGGGAPTNAKYIVAELHVGLSAEIAPSAADLVPVSSSSSAAAWGTVPDAALTSNYSGVGACGANTWASTLNDNAAPTCTQPAFSNISGTALYTQGGTGQTTAPDDNVLLGNGTGWALKALTSCVGTAKAVTYDAATNTWGCNTITASGVVNVVETSVAITSAGSYFTATVTGQTWVTASSVIVCSVLGTDADGLTAETIAIATPRATVANRVAGTGYDLLIANPYGLEGTIRVQCTGA